MTFREQIDAWLTPLGYVPAFENHPLTPIREYHYSREGVRVICVNDASDPHCYLHKDIMEGKFTYALVSRKYEIGFPELKSIHNMVKRKAKLTQLKESGKGFQYFQHELGVWSDNAFGLNRPPTAPLHHLLKEVEELIDKEGKDPEEFADCLMLLLDAARMANLNTKELLKQCNLKLDICKGRQWGKPDPNGVVEHIKEHSYGPCAYAFHNDDIEDTGNCRNCNSTKKH
jgi:hypothetical protein